MFKKLSIITIAAIITIAIYTVGSALAGSTTAPGSTNTIVTVKIDPGTLSMTTPDNASLANIVLDGFDTSTTGDLGTIRVIDARGSGAGWNVNVKATRFEEESIPTRRIAIGAGAFVVESVVATTISGNGGVNTTTGNLAGGGIKMLNAPINKGRGVNDADAVLRLLVPAQTYAGTYSSTVTETLASN
jgi:hypothetical protein